jgi:hypothetical protein
MHVYPQCCFSSFSYEVKSLPLRTANMHKYSRGVLPMQGIFFYFNVLAFDTLCTIFFNSLEILQLFLMHGGNTGNTYVINMTELPSCSDLKTAAL